MLKRIKYGTSVNKELVEKIIKLSEETDIPQSKLVDKAFKLLLKEYGKL